MSYGARFKYEENQKLPWGMLTVMFPVLDDDGFSTSKYTMQCECGSDPFEMLSGNISRGLKTQANWVYSCGCVSLPRKRQSRVRAKYVPNFTDMSFGRLYVQSHDTNRGYETTCTECAATVWLADPKKLAAESIRTCRNPCAS